MYRDYQQMLWELRFGGRVASIFEAPFWFLGVMAKES